MTPERLALLQQMLKNHGMNWTYGDTVFIREPVEFQRRWPKWQNVVDLPVIKKVAFTLRKDMVAMFDDSGLPLTQGFEIVWVEAEGRVISAESFDAEGESVARDMVGMACPVVKDWKRKKLK